MSTLENLFMQIFDRRNWIVDQLKSQTDSYDQSLASNLLIHGIRPPSWLWNPTGSDPQNADAKELKKEELISGLLYPPPRPPVPLSTTNFPCYSEQACKVDNVQLSENFVMETCASNKCFVGGDGSTAVPKGSIDEHEHGQTFNTDEGPELIPTPTCRVQVDPKTSDMHFEQDQSLLKFQRSRSRQKALELRNSAKSKMKRRSLKEIITNEYSSRVARSRTAHQHLACIMGSPKLKNSLGISAKYGARVTRSSSTSCEPNRVDKSLLLAKPINCVGDDGFQRAVDPHVTMLLEHAIVRGSPPSKGANDIANQKIYVTEIVDTELVPDTPDAAGSLCSGSKMASANHGLNVSVSRPPIDSNNFVEPKHLNFDDMEECSLKQVSSPVLEEEKQETLFEIRALTKSPPGQSPKGETMTEDVLVTIDFVKESSLPSQSPKRETISNDIQETRDFAELVPEEILHNTEILNGDLEALKFSIAGQVEKRLDLIEADKIGNELSSVSFTFKTSNLSAPSLKNRTSVSSKEISGDALADISPVSSSIPNQTEVAADLLSTSQEVGGKTSLGSQLPMAVDLSFPKIVVAPQIVSSIDHKCIGDLEPTNMSEACGFAAAACDVDRKSMSTVISDSDPMKCNILLEAHETKFNALAIDATILEQALTPKAGQTHNHKPQYFLRSSTSCDRNLGHLKSNGSDDVMKSRQWTKTIDNACEISWPICKRRNIESSLNNVFNTSPRVRKSKPQLQQIHEYSIRGSLRSSKNALVIPEFQHFPSSHDVEVDQLKVVIENSGSEMYQNQKCHKTEGSELFSKLQLSSSTRQEGEFDLKGKDQNETSPVKSSLDMTKQADGYSQGHLKEVGETAPEGTESDSVLNEERQLSSDGGVDPLDNGPRQEDLKHSAHTEGIMEEMKPNFGDHCLFSSYSGRPSCNENLDIIGADKSMPEYEGFSVGVPPEIVVQNGINLEDLVHFNVSSITKEQTGVLEPLFRSTSVFTPLPNPSTKYKIHMTPDVCQFLPDGLLEHVNLRKALLFNHYDGKCCEDGDPVDFSCYSSSIVDASLLGRSHSDCMPSSSGRVGWDVSKPPRTPPPDGNIYQRIISKSTGPSSEKLVSLNPEFTCFRIDEDTSLDEVVDSIQQETEDILNKREALVDVTSVYHNSPTLVSVAGKFLDRDSIDSVNTEFSSFGTQMGVNKKLQNGYGSNRRYKVLDKENHNPSIAGNGVRKANEFHQDRFSRSKLSEKTSDKKGRETFLEKGCRHNNIISNISSLIPLVQQKQATAVLTGKRDIKVKALETAETAKRLEEKKENERKLRKEAAKVEREKLENIRQLEMKRKEEERKKKEADMAARKRQREEEERKEKGRKRKCIEEVRRQQKEHDAKLRVEKEEKELRRKAADEERKRKELAEETKRPHKREKGKEEARCKKRTEVEPSSVKVVAGLSKHASSIQEDHEISEVRNRIGKVVSDSVNSNKANEDRISVIEGNQELQSYQMSPYQGSDDEEEEDDKEHNDKIEKKFIPSWARPKCLVQSLSSLEHMDPTEIFLREKCFSLSEVLLPRKQKPL